MPRPHSSWSLASAALSPIARFAIVGAVGFLIDAVVITILVSFAEWAPWAARAISFPSAVSATWLMNRSFTFVSRESRQKLTEAFWYGLIQIGGALINLGIFVALLPYASNDLVVVPLAIGAIGGLAFNFTASSLWLYAER